MLIVRRFLQDVSAVIGLAIVVFAVLVALLAEQIAPYPLDAYESHLTQRFQPPSWKFPFGTDNLGRDLFSRVILGTQSALVLAVTLLIGVVYAIVNILVDLIHGLIDPRVAEQL